MIDVLLATYNGEKYLPAQLKSLEEQTYQDFRLYVLDDASSDGTVGILQDYKSRHPESTELILDTEHTGDPSKNFFRLLTRSRQDYTMFCDQDDVWAHEKVRFTLQEMQRQEENDPYIPRLVHTDLEVVSADLQPVARSFMHYEHLDPHYTSLPRLIVQNNVTGCTILLNRLLRERIRVPDPMFMYDWWIALTCSAFGKISYLKDATVLYRQHGANAVGAADVRSPAYQAGRLQDSQGIRRSIGRTYALASCFEKVYGRELQPEQQQFLTAYTQSRHTGAFQRFRVLSKYKAYKKGIGRRIAQILMG